MQTYQKFGYKIKANLFGLGILVFIAYLFVFFFVELKSLKSQSFVTSFITTIVLASMVLIIGILTVIPNFSLYVGRTLVLSSFLIILTKAVQILSGKFEIFVIIEVLIGLTSFLYGYELIKRFSKQ